MASNKREGFESSIESHKNKSLIPLTIHPSSSSALQSGAAIEDLKDLKTMKWIRAVAMDAEQRGVKGRADKLRLEELKQVAYDADDVVDEYEFELLCAKIRLGGDNHKRKREDDYKSKHSDEVFSQVIVPVASELVIRMKKIKERFDEIISGWEALRLDVDEGFELNDVGMVRPPQTSSLVHEPSILGRDDDKENIIKSFIFDNSNSSGDGSLCVLPLVGMGGIGKTTLAQLIYNDHKVCEYFQLKAWVCVSEDFSVESLTRNIIISFDKRDCDFTKLEDLQRTLMNVVKGKRFLIVLDDVWNEKPSLWKSLKAPLTGYSFGKIIVTTRNENVARYMQTTSSYALTYLPFDHCWSLFKQLAFECQDRNSNPDMIEIGREIVRKCGGLPLAVKAIGSLLQFEGDEESWREILDSEIWELEMSRNEVLPALKISYDRLPMHLKRCFVFLSLFPKDYVILENDIVRLWLSLNFVLPRGEKSAEDIGVDYVTELLQRSLLELTDGEERCFNMHDLVNDLAQSVSGKDFSRTGPKMLHNLPYEMRHISIVSNNPTDIIDLQCINHLKAPRLLQLVDTMNNRCRDFNSCQKIIPPELFRILKHLRALDFSFSDIDILPDSIGNLKQLRYLNVRNTMVKKLPDSICDLYNLQTLELENSHVKELPNRIGCLINLRHIRARFDTCIPPGIGKLLDLQTLPYFTVKPGTWHCALPELRNLVNLRDTLSIGGLRYVTSLKDATQANLFDKPYLKHLVLSWPEHGEPCKHLNREGPPYASVDSTELLGVLQPHANIEELHILNYSGSSYPSWLGATFFSKLVKIHLDGISSNIKILPTLGQLPSLRDLTIMLVLSIENVGHEFCSRDSKIISFKSLKTLEFKHMLRWVNWSGVENGDFCCLQTLKLKFCDKLQFIPQPLCSSLATLEMEDCGILTTPRILPYLNCLIIRGRINEIFFDDLHLPLLKTLKLARLSISNLVVSSHNIPSIEAIDIIGCEMLRTVVGLSGLGSLKTLKIHRCRNLELPSDEWLSCGLQRLDVVYCPQLCEWEQLQIKKIKEARLALYASRGNTSTNKT